MAAGSTTSDKIPTPIPGVKPWKGKPKPVTLVARLVTKKIRVQPSIGSAVSSPYKTTKPKRKPTNLTKTCKNKKVVIPKIILRPPLVRLLDELKILDQHSSCRATDYSMKARAAGYSRGPRLLATRCV